MTSSTRTLLFKHQTAAILVMMAGWGWIAGNFAAPFDTFWIGAVTTLGHCLPIVLLLVSGVQFLSAHEGVSRESPLSHWGQVIITMLAILAIVGAIVLSVIGASNSNPNAVGIKTIDDYIPAILLVIGSFWWLATLLVSASRGRKHLEQRTTRNAL
jgi:hypothetical protein